MIFFHFDIRERMNVSFHVGKIIVDMYIYIFEYDSLLFQSLFLFFQSLLFRYRTTVRVTPPLLLRKIYLSLS